MASLLGRLRQGLCAALSVFCSLACEPAAAPAPVAAGAARGSAAAGSSSPSEASPVFAWRARVGPSTVYLLGSVHVARPELYPLDPRIERSFEESQVLVLELALDEETQLAAARRMLELGRLEPGRRLKDVVTPETWRLLEQAQARRRQNLFGLRGLRPWLVAVTLTTQTLQQEGFSSEHGIDEHFRRAAERGGKRVESLETVDEQLTLFTSLSAPAEEQLLRQTLEQLEGYDEELDAAFDLWRVGDAGGIDRLLISPMQSEYPDLHRRLFSDRNRAMTERLIELTKVPGTYFVVVGAGHLVGSSGILELLRQRGIPSQQL